MSFARHGARGLALAAALAALAPVGCGSSHRGYPSLPARSHVVVVVLENKSYSELAGPRQAPSYITGLARRAAVPSAMFGVTHPSLPNYLALVSGRTFGLTQDCTDCHVSGPNLATQLDRAGISWRAYMEGMPRPCYRGAFAGRYPPGHGGLTDPAAERSISAVRGFGRRYAKKHDPFMYFDDVRNNPSACSHVVPFWQLARNRRAGTLPTFVWITPDLCHDMHDCVVHAGDRFLAQVVPELLPRLGPRGFMVITFDEGVTDRGCCAGDAHGGRIPTFVLGPNVLARAGGTAPYDHYSTLKTIEQAFGLPLIGHARDPQTNALDSLFKTPPRIPRGA